MSGPVELVYGRSARIQRVLTGMLAPFEQARDAYRERLEAAEIEVHLLDAPDECIPELGIGGSTYGPHTIVLAVDPDHRIDAINVYSTLVHEIHHAIRWRGPGCGTSLGERLVSEGLAQVFEAECTGRAPMYAEGEVSAEDRALALAALGEDPADEGRWFFGTADLPRWFGYRLGYNIVKHSPAMQQHDAAQMVREPAARFLPDIQPSPVVSRRYCCSPLAVWRVRNVMSCQSQCSAPGRDSMVASWGAVPGRVVPDLDAEGVRHRRTSRCRQCRSVRDGCTSG